jgi:DNA repair exonuclease SbcCD ATPase subunit
MDGLIYRRLSFLQFLRVRITKKEVFQMKSVMFVRGLLAIMLLLALGALPGCGEKEQPQSEPANVSKEDVKEEVKEAYDATKAYTQEQMQAFREETETRLAEYKEKIDQLEAKAEELGEDAKAKAEEQLTVLREKRDEVSEKLKELSSSSGNAWEQVKSGIDAALEDLGNAYKKAVAEFSKS